jgi:uncharacterized membrane protein (DUF485 family)
MEMGSYLHLLNFIFMLVTASVPAYLAIRLRGTNRRLLYLSAGLTIFALVHALYHLADFLELVDLADSYLLPFSVVLLVLYGVYYYKTGV